VDKHTVFTYMLTMIALELQKVRFEDHGTGIYIFLSRARTHEYSY